MLKRRAVCSLSFSVQHLLLDFPACPELVASFLCSVVLYSHPRTVCTETLSALFCYVHFRLALQTVGLPGLFIVRQRWLALLPPLPSPPPATVPLHPVCVWRASSSCGFACMLCIVWKFGALKRTHCCLCRGHFEKARGSPFARHGRCKFSHCGGENRTAYGGGVPILAQKAQCRHFSESVHRDCKPLSCYLRRAEEKGSCHTHSSSRESTVFRTL